jgi:putative phage-type endonuclease
MSAKLAGIPTQRQHEDSTLTLTGVLIGQYAARSAEWHDARRTRIGGSEVAAVLGLSPWQSPYSLWHAKRNGWIDETTTAQQDWGTRMEPALLDWYFDHHGVRSGPDGTYIHGDRDWQLFNPDALGYDGDPAAPVIVEAKTARRGDDWGQPGTDEIPVYYRTQVVWGMDCLGIPTAHVVASIAGAPPEVWTVEYNPAEADEIRSQVEAFVISLQEDVEPELDSHTATYETVRKMHPRIDGGERVELSNSLALSYLTAKRNLKAAEAAEQEATTRLIAAMGDAQYATWLGERIARRQAKQGGSPFPVITLKEGK